MNEWQQIQQKKVDQLQSHIDTLNELLRKERAISDARFGGRLQFPINTERAMLGEGLHSRE
jgi:hypothetical protein